MPRYMCEQCGDDYRTPGVCELCGQTFVKMDEEDKEEELFGDEEYN